MEASGHVSRRPSVDIRKKSTGSNTRSRGDMKINLRSGQGPRVAGVSHIVDHDNLRSVRPIFRPYGQIVAEDPL